MVYFSKWLPLTFLTQKRNTISSVLRKYQVNRRVLTTEENDVGFWITFFMPPIEINKIYSCRLSFIMSTRYIKGETIFVGIILKTSKAENNLEKKINMTNLNIIPSFPRIRVKNVYVSKCTSSGQNCQVLPEIGHPLKFSNPILLILQLFCCLALWNMRHFHFP